jgi:hypothetical protein
MVKHRLTRLLALAALVLGSATCYGLFSQVQMSAGDVPNSTFISYSEFSDILRSRGKRDQVEFVALCHPSFEADCYRHNKCVMSVKLAHRPDESFVLVPENDRITVLDSLQTRGIPTIAVN